VDRHVRQSPQTGDIDTLRKAWKDANLAPLWGEQARAPAGAAAGGELSVVMGDDPAV